MAHQASKKRCLLPPDHHRIGCYTSNGINSQTVPGCIRLARRFLLRVSELRIPSILHPSAHTQGSTCRERLSPIYSELDEGFFIIRS